MNPKTILHGIVLFACCLIAASAYAIESDRDLKQQDKPLKVFILVGQSNMQGHANVRTFEHIGMDPETAPLLAKMQNEDGTTKVCDDVWISYLSASGHKRGRLTAGFGADDNKIGPELTFGITMHHLLDEPVLIIKTAWGGKSLHTDFRPPGAEPFEFTDEQLEQFKQQNKDIEAIRADKLKATGHYYRLMMDHVKTVLSDIGQVVDGYDPEQGYEIAGFVWFQGWNDMVDRGVYPRRNQPGGYDQYTDLLVQFIRDVRSELSASELPFVIGVMGVGGPTDLYSPEQQRYKSVHQNFRDAMAAAASQGELGTHVANVLTEKYWDLELTDLRAREARIRQRGKQVRSERNLAPAEEKAIVEELRGEEFTAREMEILKKGVSNAEYHYLGSSKIMALIGKGFAEAMFGLIDD